MKVTLPDPIAEQLEKLAAKTGEPVARIAGQMVRDGLPYASGQRHAIPVQPTPVAPGEADDGIVRRAPWLRPYDDPDWPMVMWGSILRLYKRYPKALQGLKDGWWKDNAHVEQICALVVWREQLDTNGQDPREELTFQHQLAHYSQKLQQEGGSVTQAWTPNTAPNDWR